MGFRGHVELRAEARRLRAGSQTLAEIAATLGVAKSSVSVWVRDVDFTPRPRSSARRRGPNRLQLAKQAEIDSALEWGRETIATLSERDFLIAGAALYAGEGAKRDGSILFANSDPRMVLLFVRWLPISSPSTSRDFACASTCTRVSILRLRLGSGLV